MSNPSNDNESARNVICPTCGKDVDEEATVVMPFCSPRCKQIDLGRWLGEEIGMPLDPERDRQGEPNSEHGPWFDSMN